MLLIPDTWTTLGLLEEEPYTKFHDGTVISWSSWQTGEPNRDDEPCAYLYTNVMVNSTKKLQSQNTLWCIIQGWTETPLGPRAKTLIGPALQET